MNTALASPPEQLVAFNAEQHAHATENCEHGCADPFHRGKLTSDVLPVKYENVDAKLRPQEAETPQLPRRRSAPATE